jgi:hypothetical protein
MPASQLNPYATGTVTMRWLPGDSPELPALAPGTHYADKVLLVTGGQLHPASVTPNSAAGCTPVASDFAACISITGKGATIDQWETDAYYSHENNTCEPQWLLNGAVHEEHEYGCGYGPGRYFDYSAIVPYTVHSSTKACNRWIGAYPKAYEPCETVKP